MDVFVFVDALGWDLVGESGYLADILPHRRPVRMQFGYSSTAIPTILSGLRPDVHGHLGLFAYAPERSPFRLTAAAMSLLRPKSFWNRGRVRGRLSKVVGRLLGFTGYFQLYRMTPEKLRFMDYCEKRDIFAPGGLAPAANLADALAASGVRHHVSDWRRSDAENFAVGERAVREGCDFAFVYTASLDAVRHDNATPDRRAAVDARLAWYRGRIEALARAAGESGRPWSLTVFSDHGMTPLSKTIDVQAAIDAAGLRFGIDYGACVDSTLFRVHFLRPGARERVLAAMERFADDGHWLDGDEERREGIWREDRMFGDMMFLANPGVQIVPSDMGAAPLGGMHGYDPGDLHSLAAVMSTRPIPDWVRGVPDYFRLMSESFPRPGVRVSP